MSSVDWTNIEMKLEQLFDTLLGIDVIEEDLEIFPHMQRVVDNMTGLSEFIGNMSSKIQDKKELSILLILSILWYIDGGLSFWINSTIYWLIRQGHHDIWDDIKQNFVMSFNEISYIPLSVKIKFLEKHDLGFINKIAHRDIRNAFAHQNYTINEEGSVLIYKRQKVVKTLNAEDMLSILDDIRKLLEINTNVFASKINWGFDELKEFFGTLSVKSFEEIVRKHLQDKEK